MLPPCGEKQVVENILTAVPLNTQCNSVSFAFYYFAHDNSFVSYDKVIL